MKYKPLLDPSVNDGCQFCMNLCKPAQDERCLFYYNGHGVPKPTASGELWDFNKSYTQYSPISFWDMQNWLAARCRIYVWDTSSAGYLLSNFVRVAEQRDTELKAQHVGVFPEGFVPCAESLQLAGYLAGEPLPMCPDLPADLFTSWLTSPIETAMRWFLSQGRESPYRDYHRHGHADTWRPHGPSHSPW
ncbi:raptor N-terminal caspase like domain-containing protein [Gautieria morchelliformis]|nr:raptor N-terminal caspase like domain-containing protein [Gautieria morchelliformis]